MMNLKLHYVLGDAGLKFATKRLCRDKFFNDSLGFEPDHYCSEPSVLSCQLQRSTDTTSIDTPYIMKVKIRFSENNLETR